MHGLPSDTLVFVVDSLMAQEWADAGAVPMALITEAPMVLAAADFNL